MLNYCGVERGNDIFSRKLCYFITFIPNYQNLNLHQLKIGIYYMNYQNIVETNVFTEYVS